MKTEHACETDVTRGSLVAQNMLRGVGDER